MENHIHVGLLTYKIYLQYMEMTSLFHFLLFEIVRPTIHVGLYSLHLAYIQYRYIASLGLYS